MKRIAVLLLICISMATGIVFADGPVAISSPEDLFLLAEDPNGDFVLTEDIYMTEELAWQPVVFYGHLD